MKTGSRLRQHAQPLRLLLLFGIFLSGLVGCGGGGGSGGGTPTQTTPVVAKPPAVPMTPIVRTPVTTFTPTTPTAPASVRAPVYTAGTTDPAYMLGSKDTYYMAGCPGNCYADSGGTPVDIRDSTSSVYSDGVTGLHRRIEGPNLRDPSLTVPEPPLDVRQAWRDGWTGDGVNILIVDDFGVAGRRITRPQDERGTHGYTVGMSAAEIAPEGDYSVLQSGLSGSGTAYRQGGVFGGTRSTKYDVINWSFGLINPSNGVPTTAEVLEEQRDPRFQDLLGRPTDYLTNTQDAVITKAAGNSSGDAGHFADTVALVTHSSTGSRVLIVGTLDSYARTSDPQSQANVSTSARITDSSERAGGNTAVQDCFLVEYGGTPYGETAYLCDASTPANIGCSNLQILDSQNPFLPLAGTSFATPRVAGFAALVRDKFPNLTGPQTANILLETATTRGLSCHAGVDRKSTGCAENIYGQGRVDIGNALASVGAVR